MVLVGTTTCALQLGGRSVRVDIYDGKMAVQWDVRYDRRTAPSVEAGAIDVRNTGDGRGRGAFATRPIAAGTFLGYYVGEELSREQVESKYLDKQPEYVLRIDADLYVDGSASARASTFTPAVMNHDDRPNVVRYCSRRRNPAMVDFFTDRDIETDEELCFDYGAGFWLGREESLIEKIDTALDRQWFDPEDRSLDSLAWLRAKYRQNPETAEAAYVAVTLSALVFVGQLIVRWYKYNVWGHPPSI